ncbi:hypothetical protein PHYSODRAFT_483167 [Phytophthora sojae]|uniref:Uncharacterized protein n=1 Tax=Phytophthora sojae (strain P6497) TaxID=1094619 RepID=G4YSA3_PHYSP|nr:hypothetical protein PHYSODRAFT_483167 [Phytophthora sojae]EGZ25334.1 hypothetical protein PHYSODRAFT_483167 [Phytophthora sojae]|eukprot:XP_009520622.1 hypothetical protein PHYSODRAFT_483167 [Phytophthora sojae]
MSSSSSSRGGFLRNRVAKDSAFLQRSRDFDSSVSRDKAILLCIHNGVLAMGVSLVRELRCLGNEELIQVYHCGPEELSDESRELLFSIDDRLETVDVWWIKPLALYDTDVRHVILMDVDDIIMKDPAYLRSLKPYQTTGTTFFYDRVHANCSEHLNGKDGDMQYLKKLLTTFDYGRFNLSEEYWHAPSRQALESFAYAGKTCHEMDSSLVLVDKERAGQTVLDIMLWFITEERLRFRYSFGDKETFWLSFELAHVPYSFSPWGVSVVSSTPSRDMEKHPDSLCGSILQYMPSEDRVPEMLYVNGKALLDPYPQGIGFVRQAQWNNMFNSLPTHMTPRLPRTELTRSSHEEKLWSECMMGLGSTPLPKLFAGNLLRRRMHYWGVLSAVTGALQQCEIFQ